MRDDVVCASRNRIVLVRQVRRLRRIRGSGVGGCPFDRLEGRNRGLWSTSRSPRDSHARPICRPPEPSKTGDRSEDSRQCCRDDREWAWWAVGVVAEMRLKVAGGCSARPPVTAGHPGPQVGGIEAETFPPACSACQGRSGWTATPAAPSQRRSRRHVSRRELCWPRLLKGRRRSGPEGVSIRSGSRGQPSW